MTARPDVLGPDERVDAAWASLTSHHYRHLPVVEGDRCVGVVSLRDLMGVARIRPAGETSGDVPAGLEGVVVAETTIGDVRGLGGLLPLPPVLGGRAGGETITRGRLASPVQGRAARRGRVGRLRRGGPAAAHPAAGAQHRCCPRWPPRGAPLDVLRTAVSLLGAELGWRPTHDIGADELYDQALGLCAVVPTILAAAHRLRQGDEPIEPRADLGFAANYLYMLTGNEPSERTPGPSSST